MIAVNIRPASPAEFTAVRAFYHSLIDAMEGAAWSPGWKKGIYPNDQDLQTALERGWLFVAERDGETCAAMVVNQETNAGYQKVKWPVKARPSEFTVIHMLGVHPRFGRQGIGKELVAWVLKRAYTQSQKAVRLDVLKGNCPAERLYARMGFYYVDTVPMFYEDTGWTDYELFEYPL